MVKDLRKGLDSHRPQAILDGDLDAFMEAALAARIQGGEETPSEELE
jgi:peptide chain release factor 2